MARRSMLLLVVALGLLAFVPFAQSSAQTVSATATLSGEGATWSLALRNTGDEVINCMAAFAPTSLTFAAVTGPPTVVLNNDKTAYFAGLTLNLQPGQIATWELTFSGAWDGVTRLRVAISTNCSAGSDTDATVNVIRGPCECLRLEAKIVPKLVAFVNPGELGGMHLQLTFAWTMTCLAGQGSCVGRLDLVPPLPVKTYRAYFKPRSARIVCKANCGETKSGTAKLVLIGGRALGHDKRGKAVKSIKIGMKRTCQSKQLKARTFTLVFNKIGQINKKKSDFNADGKPG